MAYVETFDLKVEAALRVMQSRLNDTAINDYNRKDSRQNNSSAMVNIASTLNYANHLLRYECMTLIGLLLLSLLQASQQDMQPFRAETTKHPAHNVEARMEELDNYMEQASQYIIRYSI